MFDYAICEIGGKQYKLVPGQPVDILINAEPNKKIEVAPLALSEDGKVKLGKPELKDKIILKCLEMVKGEKIRVAKFHAKANYRRVRGHRAQLARIVWDVKKELKS